LLERVGTAHDLLQRQSRQRTGKPAILPSLKGLKEKDEKVSAQSNVNQNNNSQNNRGNRGFPYRG
jgi:hypothetical protein